MKVSEKVREEVLAREALLKNAKPEDTITIKSRVNIREYIEEPQEEAQEDETIKTA